MAIVDIKQLQLSYPDHASKIWSGLPALGPLQGREDQRHTLYDPVWGYFTFSQQVGFTYNEADTYRDVTVFTIEGVFTRHAEGFSDDPINDSEALDAIVAKYEALVNMFDEAAQGAEPDDFAAWGGEEDSRMIALPSPLRDHKGEQIYALPGSIRIMESVFAQYIKYIAILNELPLPLGKLIVGETLMDNGVLTIALPTPIMQQHEMIGATGSAMGVENYSSLGVDISATLPFRVSKTDMFTGRLGQFVADAQKDTISLKVASKDEVITLWQDMDFEQPEISGSYKDQMAQVSISCKESRRGEIA